ncbi:MAG TPA: family 20 glycosylhydrolase [Gemmatimonadales bacterium]|jgi:hexosaminidase
MRMIFQLLTAMATVPAAAAQAPQTLPTLNLMPVPAAVTATAARLAVDSTFSVGIVRYRDSRLERGVSRAIARLSGRLGAPISRQFGNGRAASLVIDVAGQGFAIPDLSEDESYHLSVGDQGAVLQANTVVGALRGLETFLQLQDTDARGVFVHGAEIRDSPRFRWRGLLLDVSRHFEPVDVIKRTLDGMAMVKLNVFHWHLSDDQGFRVESRIYPRLQEFGSDSQFYTQDQIREIVAYAADRGIRVMPEFDVPGHSSSWFVGYPDLASGPGPFVIARTWGTFPPTMDPTRESTYKFLDAFIGEISALFPDHYWHVGGDEVEPGEWHQNPAIQSWMKAHGIPNEVGLHTAFNKRLFAIVEKHGKIPVGWDEIFQPDLPTAAVIQSWRSSDALAASARAGFRGVLSAPYYIDHMKPASDFYLPDPLPAGTTLTPEEQARILGGEACMWSEYVTPETIDSRIWPRLAVIAERFWSPGTVNDVSDMYRRLDPASRELDELGIHQIDHSRRMVRRFGGDSTALFESLLDFVRPPDFGGSGPNQFVPHTRLIDAAVPDPRRSWDMAGRARRAVLGDTAAVTRLRADFSVMMSLRTRLASAGNEYPAATDAAPVAAALFDLGKIGIGALDLMAQRAAPNAAWRATSDSIVTKTARQRSFGPLRPATADAVRILLNATADLPSPPGSP